jgi:hypothetical protein
MGFTPLFLFSDMFRSSARAAQAAREPFHSLKQGNVGDGVHQLQLALFNIQEHSDSLPPELRPVKVGTYFVFFCGDEFSSQTFGPHTNFSIQAFQTQRGGITVDGKAGVDTIPRLDEIVFFLESIGLIDEPGPDDLS